MITKEEKVALYKAANKELGLGLSDDLIEKVTSGLGLLIYNADIEHISCSEQHKREVNIEHHLMHYSL